MYTTVVDQDVICFSVIVQVSENCTLKIEVRYFIHVNAHIRLTSSFEFTTYKALVYEMLGGRRVG